MSNRTYQGPPIDMTYNHLSERDGQTVGGTTDDDKGEIKTDTWPESAPPKDELKEDHIAVIEAAADPSREWNSMAELGAEVVPHRSRTYASDFLRRRWPEGRKHIASNSNDSTKDGKDTSSQGSKFVCDSCGDTFVSPAAFGGHRRHCTSEGGYGASLSIQDVEKIRRCLLDGKPPSELSGEFGCSNETIRRAAKGEGKEYVDENKIELPPLNTVGNASGTKYTLPDGCEDTDATTLDRVEEESEPEPEQEPERESITSDSGTTDKRSNQLRTVALAILAFIFGWAINK